MDIDEMKKNWGALNARLEKSEAVNGEVLRKILSQKAVGGYDKIRNREKTGLYALVLFAIMFPIQYASGVIQHWYSLAVIEALIVGCIGYSIYCLKALPKYDQYKNGVVGMMKTTARYQKLFATNGPILIAAITLAIVLFYYLEGKGFQSDIYHKMIFFCAIAVLVTGSIRGYRKTKEQLAEINSNLEELHKFEME
ncbi:MAG: hypothetical protein K2O88_02335 [Paramuribaculum sp.]|nr:hypothetical protein [Paramuribaculum sp.]